MITDSEAPPPSEAEKLDGQAAEATAQVNEMLDRVISLATEAKHVNALGDHADQASTLRNILEAKKELSNAHTLILMRRQPPERTYEKVPQ